MIFGCWNLVHKPRMGILTPPAAFFFLWGLGPWSGLTVSKRPSPPAVLCSSLASCHRSRFRAVAAVPSREV